jgi:hypothetical protein
VAISHATDAPGLYETRKMLSSPSPDGLARTSHDAPATSGPVRPRPPELRYGCLCAPPRRRGPRRSAGFGSTLGCASPTAKTRPLRSRGARRYFTRPDRRSTSKTSHIILLRPVALTSADSATPRQTSTRPGSCYRRRRFGRAFLTTRRVAFGIVFLRLGP